MGTPITTAHLLSPDTSGKDKTPVTAINLAQALVENTKTFKPLEELRNALKEEIRHFGPATYTVDGGTVQVHEAEVKTFKAKVLMVDQAAFEKLNTKMKSDLLNLGVVRWEDTFTRDAKAKVETTLA